MKKMFRKADYILLAVLIVIGTAVSAALSFGHTGGDKVVIKVDGREYATYSLSEDRIVTVENDGRTNVVVIEDGSVNVTEASCHNQVCVKHATISRTGESIVCLPNKMIVTIEGKGEDFDAISG